VGETEVQVRGHACTEPHCGKKPALRQVGKQYFCKRHVPEAFKAAKEQRRTANDPTPDWNR
jgi:hypothetical protein